MLIVAGSQRTRKWINYDTSHFGQCMVYTGPLSSGGNRQTFKSVNQRWRETHNHARSTFTLGYIYLVRGELIALHEETRIMPRIQREKHDFISAVDTLISLKRI